ncbi:hypothetical protein CHUAL_013373 [Chamberlinius hualienensis]
MTSYTGRRQSFPVVANDSTGATHSAIIIDSTMNERSNSILVPDKLQPLKVTVNRRATNQAGFEDDYNYQQQPPKGCCQSFTDTLQYEFSKERLKRGVKARFPFIEWMRNYNIKEFIVGDIVSGITVGIMQIPLGMAYALLAGCPPETGLYTSFFSVIIYCFLGTSKHISQGTFAVISLMFAKAVQTYSTPSAGSAVANGETNVSSVFDATMMNEVESVTSAVISSTTAAIAPATAAAVGYTATEVAAAMAMLVGILQIIFGFLRFGALNIYMSDTLVSGFTTGAAVLVFTSQFNAFFGIKTPQYGWPFEIVYKYIYIFSNWPSSNVPTIIVSIIAIVVLAGVAEFINPPFQAKFKVPIPIELLAVVVGTGVSYAMDFSGTYKINIVGYIPSGLPVPRVPPTTALASSLIGDAFAVAIVSYVIQLSLAKIFAKKYSYEINANQEFLAVGAGNVFGSFFQCFPMCVALSRSMVHDSVGGKTQLASLIACVVVLIVLLAIAPLFQTLPNCVLAAIIVVAIRRMFLQFRDLKKAWGISKLEGLTWLITFLSVSLINIDVGLGIGVLFSLLSVVWRSQKPDISILGLLPNTELYKDIKRYPQAREEPGIKIYQFAAPLIFANIKTFRKEMYVLTGVNPRILLRKRQKQTKKEEAAAVKAGKRRRSLINSGTQSSDSLDTLMTPKPLHNRTISTSNGLGINNAGFQPEFKTGNFSVKDGLDTLNSSIVTLNIVNLENGCRRLSVANGREQSSGTNGTSTIATVDRWWNTYFLPVHHLIIDLSCASFVDTSGVQVLIQVIDEYKKIDISVYIAACPAPILDMFDVSRFYDTVPRETVFPTINDAVSHALYNHSLNNTTI